MSLILSFFNPDKPERYFSHEGSPGRKGLKKVWMKMPSPSGDIPWQDPGIKT